MKVTPLPTLTLKEKNNGFVVENPTLRFHVSSKDGTIHLYHKPTKKYYNQCLIVEDSGDIGDEYNYCPPQHDQRITSLDNPKVAIKVIEKGPIISTFEVHLHLKVPKAAHPTRKRRSSQKTIIPIRHLLTITSTSSRIDIQTTITNTANDHRLRVLFPTGINTTTAWGDTPFYVNERPISPAPQEWDIQLYPIMMDFYLTSILNQPNVPGKPMGWFEDSTPTHAMQTFVDVNDSKRGLLIATRGLPEYEVLEDKPHTIALTLLRSIGWLSREDLTTRRGHAGPKLATPGAQCLGTHILHYAIIPHQKTWRESTIQTQIQTFITPLKAIQIQESNTGNLHSSQSFLLIEPNNCIFSCLKKAEESESSILRFYELFGQPSTPSVQSAIPLKPVIQLNLAEQPLTSQEVKQIDAYNFTIPISAYQIQTLQLSPQKE